MFKNLECPKETNPLLLQKLCIYYYANTMPAAVHLPAT